MKFSENFEKDEVEKDNPDPEISEIQTDCAQTGS